jgi:hypothetical protein
MWAKIAAGGVILYGLAKARNWYTDTDDDFSKYNSTRIFWQSNVLNQTVQSAAGGVILYGLAKARNWYTDTDDANIIHPYFLAKTTF